MPAMSRLYSNRLVPSSASIRGKYLVSERIVLREDALIIGTWP